MKAQKHHTWQDAIDTAEHLIRLGWTEKRHLALWGISAGGIMVGRAITERPDLFAAAVGEVGLFNTLRFERTANGPGNDAEFGTVKKEDEFHALRAMDACQAVRKGVRYPAVLLVTGANDPRVEPWIVGKFAAHLQAASTHHPGALLRVDYQAGHHAASNEAQQAMALDVYSFVLANTR
jgi:prolyl oligopeptidase